MESRPRAAQGLVEAVRENRVALDFDGADVAARELIAIAIDRTRQTALVGGRARAGLGAVDRRDADQVRPRESAVVGERTEFGIDVELVRRLEAAILVANCFLRNPPS